MDIDSIKPPKGVEPFMKPLANKKGAQEALKVKDRLTVILAVHHIRQEDEPLNFKVPVSYFCETMEEPFKHVYTVTPEWVAIETGPFLKLENVGGVTLYNMAGKNLVTNPTEEEKKQIAESVVLLSFDKVDSHSWRVLPGWPYWGAPALGQKLYMRTVKHSVRCRVTVYPR